jgi:aspartate carbamoyltransferase catalytic subunit
MCHNSDSICLLRRYHKKYLRLYPKTVASMMLATRSLCAIAALDAAAITAILQRSAYWQQQRRGTVLSGKQVMTLFFEPSTRTRISFELAATALGASVCSVPLEYSSTSKGETLLDTITTLAAMAPDAIVVRHRDSGMAEWLAGLARQSAVVNAGDGMHEHPTQALLDAFTLERHFGTLAGKTIAIVGDIRHSRVARSNMLLLPRLGMNVRVVAPPMLMPEAVERYGVEAFNHLARGLAGVDAVMVLRLQTERMAARSLPSLEEYAALYQVNHTSLQAAGGHAVVLHPGPINRDIEISSALADDTTRCLLLSQVANGIPVRMACLEWALSA